MSENSENSMVLKPHPELVPKQGVVDMAVSMEQLKARMNTLEKLKTEILNDNDYAVFKDSRGGDIKAIRKTGWLKMAVAFNLTTIITKEERVPLDDGKFAWYVTVQCIAPNGRVTEEIGVCDNDTDRPRQAEHVIKTMAKTRATSRAISGMVGAADTNADDMDAVKHSKPEGPLCICKPEERVPSEETITEGEHAGQLMCKHCAWPISALVSDSIIKKREDSS